MSLLHADWNACFSVLITTDKRIRLNRTEIGSPSRPVCPINNNIYHRTSRPRRVETNAGGYPAGSVLFRRALHVDITRRRRRDSGYYRHVRRPKLLQRRPTPDIVRRPSATRRAPRPWLLSSTNKFVTGAGGGPAPRDIKTGFVCAAARPRPQREICDRPPRAVNVSKTPAVLTPTT